jgi:tetratricopeptide (TPR) repeat protein
VPMPIKLTLQGEGNLRSSVDPIWFLPKGFRLQFEGKQDRTFVENLNVRGERNYHYWIIGQTPGTYTLGKVAIRYFNPEKKSWLSAQVTLPRVDVLPSNTNTEAAPIMLHSLPTLELWPQQPVKTTSPLPWQILFSKPWFWALQFMGFMVVWISPRLHQQITKRRQESPQWRERHALPGARQTMRRAQVFIRQGNSIAFYAAMSNVIADYISNKVKLSSPLIGLDQLTEVCQKAQIPGLLQNRIKVALTTCEYVRFAGVSLPAQDMRALYRDVEDVLKTFEKFWNKRKANPSSTIMGSALILFIVLGVWARLCFAQESNDTLHQGYALAVQKRYAEALSAYQQALSQGHKESELFLNLGTTYLRLGYVGRAILTFERGLRLFPRNPAIQHNLSQAKLWITHPLDSSVRPMESQISYYLNQLNLMEWAWLVLFVFWFWVLSATIHPWKPGWWLAQKKIVIGSGIIMMVIITAASLRFFEPKWYKSGVIIISQCDVRTRPYALAEKIQQISEGNKVIILRQEDTWVQIEWAPQQTGWVQRVFIETIE